MKTNKDKPLARPKVTVTLPQVKLRLEDLAFLRSLAQPQSVRCHAGISVLNRLRFLDLIARDNVQPSDKVKADVEKETIALVKDIEEAVAKKNWDMVHNISYNLRQINRLLLPIEADVLTDKGRHLLSTGEADVRVRAVGCVR